MTWKELKDKISQMTEEELQQEVVVWGEDFSIKHDCTLVKSEENQYYNDIWGGDCCYPESELEKEDLTAHGTVLSCKEGQYYIFGL